ncbi:DUF6732 family protein [Pseudooceanicola onchidii]|uniref:DUF6732 family protein n=1 Tax=Pseudooceanicola onchidii TaxID=2562279 RepID=UPI0010AA6C3F|nr:DUF6732 family protein [Pseudooceanicola onchidii]
MRIALALLMTVFTVLAGPAAAHIGHLGEVAGHGHWLGAAAIGAAIAIGLWQGLRGKASEKEDEAEDTEELSDEEPQEA